MKRRNFFLTLFGSLFLGKAAVKTDSSWTGTLSVGYSGGTPSPLVELDDEYSRWVRVIKSISGYGGCGDRVTITIDKPFKEKIHNGDCIVAARQHCIITNMISASEIELMPIYDTTDLFNSLNIGDPINLTIKWYHEI